MNENEASTKALDELEKPFVLDFLYQDSRRIGALLSQFEDSGLLTQVTEQDEKKTASGNELNAGGSLGVPLISRGNATYKRTWSSEGSRSGGRVYDPLWTNSLTLLDHLETGRLLERDASRARIGQIILVSGKVNLIDLAFVKDAWKTKSMQTLLSRTTSKLYSSLPKDEQESKKAVVDFVKELIPLLPQVVQMHLHNEDGSFWGSLLDECLLLTASEASLKFGGDLPGSWQVVGTLDALPTEGYEWDPENPFSDAHLKPFERVTPFQDMTVKFTRMAQSMVGRRPDFFALTPLMIFRSVHG